MTRPVAVIGGAIWMALSIISAAANAEAQDRGPNYRPRRMAVAAGAGMTGGYPVGEVTAALRRNALGVPPPFTLLRATTEIERAATVDLRLDYAVTRRLAVEAGGTYSAPQLGVRVSEDPEAPGDAFASERLSQYTAEVSLVYLLPRARLGTRARAFVLGGGGYLRQLHEGRIQVDTGSTIHAGGGVQYWLRGATGPRRPLGVRAEARVVQRLGGVEFEDKRRIFAGASVLGFVGF